MTESDTWTALPVSGLETRAATMTADAAYAWCRAYTRAHSENFTVGSWFLPKAHRDHFWALYAFCRFTDDLGDEALGDRLVLLDGWESGFRDCLAGHYRHPIYAALGRTLRERPLPSELFLRLIEANRMDQRQTRFQTYAELLHYCQYSATPVGRMVLGVLGYTDEERGQLADATCTGLQLANFWQDVTIDYAKGRLYLPLEDLARFGCDEAQIARREPAAAFRSLMRFEVDRAQALFDTGARLEPMVDATLRLDITLFRRGGEAVLAAIRRRNYDVLSARPPISRATKARLAASALIGLAATRLARTG